MNAQSVAIQRMLFRFMIFILIFGSALSGCTPTPSPSPESMPELPSGCTVKIGVITSLTGVYAERAEALVRGYKLAQEDINAQGGILGCSLELVIKDDASESTHAEAIVQALAEEEGVPLIIGSFSSKVTLKVAPVANQYKVPLLSHSATHFLLTRLGYDWVFRTLPPSSAEVAQLLNYAMSLPLGTKSPSLGIVFHDTAIGHSFAIEVFSQAKDIGLALTSVEPFTPGSADFAPLLKRVRDADPDIIFFSASLPEDAELLMKESAEIGLNPQVYLSVGVFNSAKFLEKGMYADYFISAIPWTERVERQDANGQTTQTFIEKFTAQYGQAPAYRSVDAYVNIYIAQQAFEAAAIAVPLDMDNINEIRLELRDALRNLDLEQTLFGPIQFDASGQNNQPSLLVQNIDGEFVVIYPPDAKTGNVVFPAPTWDAR